MNDLLAIAGVGLLFVGLWLLVGVGSAMRSVGDVPFRDRAVAMCFVTAPILAPVVILVCSLPLATILPLEARSAWMAGGVAASLALMAGMPFALWEISKTRPQLRRLWSIAAQVRQKNLEAR